MGLHVTGVCEECDASFDCDLISSGFSDIAYSYCNVCGKTAILDGWKMPPGLGIKVHGPIRENESLLLPCACGGRFTADASPRCPECRNPLSPVLAAAWMDAQAPGAKIGWRWQRDWTGVHCVIINGNVVDDNWLVPDGALAAIR